ncbi:cytochrome c oxidase subunit VII [Saccharomycopsis crataegensis]|uniref:Cytochrome c oxidase subunit VII n=1 Tax=Saccharomycopsis crataegensis TaxID=43959 RepID=A0AAV5QEA0_9ASCO|nr:cytochrome c oxidase subunit VII [Saccharomycopsis crataegensis]
MAARNRIIEYQRLYQNSTKPLWTRHPRSAMYLYPFYGLFAVSMVVPLVYTGRAILGIKDPKK